MKKTFTFLAMISFAFAHVANAQEFTPGNLAVLVAEASANNTTFSVVELSPSISGQTAATNTFPISATGANALRFSGSAGTTGYLTRTADRTLLTFSGANTTATSGNINAVLTRGVGTINHEGVFALQTTYTDKNGQQTRGATSLDNNTWYVADQEGLYTNGSGNAASPVLNLKAVKAFGGVVYASSSSGANVQVGTISASTGGTYNALSGIPTNNDAEELRDFYLISSNGIDYDILYILASNLVYKYSLVDDGTGAWTWESNGSHVTTYGGFGLAAETDGGGTNLYITTGGGALTNNSVIKLKDEAGYDQPINITSANDVTLYTASGGKIIKGIDFAPINPTTLPVKLVSFKGKSLNSAVTFNWTTATEKNFSHFEIETSFDTKSFEKIGELVSKGDVNGSAYQYTTSRGGDYYRLKMVDLNGEFEYSNVIRIAKSTTDVLLVFPNPAIDRMTIQLDKGANGSVATIISVTGQIVKTAILHNGLVELSVTDLVKGLYYVKVVDQKSKEVYTQSFIVK